MSFENFEKIIGITDFEPASLDVPEACKKCPAMQPLQRDYQLMQLTRELLQTRGVEEVMSGMPEDIREAFRNHLSYEHDEEMTMTGMSADDCIAEIEGENRKGLGEALNKIDRDLNKVELIAHAMVFACQSPLSLRASKASVEHTVTICTSTAQNPYSSRVRINRRVSGKSR